MDIKFVFGVLRHPIKSMRRLHECEERINHMYIMAIDDYQWLAHDKVAHRLTARYLNACSEYWAEIEFEPISKVRSDLGLAPYQIGEVNER